ncbi:putative intraflagellar transport protein A1 [Trypanosoma cruzi]|uniref:Putative intraflagellar transport protein A1 n=1 Tax=Trypanosoma cruzi TaxID=5693 RepID=A0A7J6Y5K1_TRYCR|nr:putative intraflagellar transport protein A1 [Trypanosoma cruzi]KAF8292014.1 putative intraflagellar transport protein A1 [Trypanosoma cruzi]
MSFRELRSFVETMRLLGYPNLISMESFRNPNVELVADCLFWLIKRYEPSAEIVYEIEREGDRIFFFKQICEVALAKGQIKLNIKKLYQSDGNAVQEMLILASVLKKAMNATEAEEADYTSVQQMVAQKNVQDAKRVQQLCSDLTSDGSALFFLIEEEISQRGERQRVLSRATEVGEFERRLRDVLANVGKQVEQLQTTIMNLSADETTLEQKIESKKTQLERAQKRLKSLMAVRPAFMEEYEKHEGDLQSQFVVYLEQYRNLEYLEHELAKFNAAEDAVLEEHETRLRVMRERLRKEELSAIRGEAGHKRGGVRANEDFHTLAKKIHHNRNVNVTEDGGDESMGVHGSHAQDWARNAAEEGSSVSDSGPSSRVEDLPRPQAALGRTRPSPLASAELAMRRNGGGEVNSRSNNSGTTDGVHPDFREVEPSSTDMRKPHLGASSSSSGYAAIALTRGADTSEYAIEDSGTDFTGDDSVSDSDTDIDTSDISTDSDDSEDSSSI